jgi:hypothetical protein
MAKGGSDHLTWLIACSTTAFSDSILDGAAELGSTSSTIDSRRLLASMDSLRLATIMEARRLMAACTALLPSSDSAASVSDSLLLPLLITSEVRRLSATEAIIRLDTRRKLARRKELTRLQQRFPTSSVTAKNTKPRLNGGDGSCSVARRTTASDGGSFLQAEEAFFRRAGNPYASVLSALGST